MAVTKIFLVQTVINMYSGGQERGVIEEVSVYSYLWNTGKALSVAAFSPWCWGSCQNWLDYKDTKVESDSDLPCNTPCKTSDPKQTADAENPYLEKHKTKQSVPVRRPQPYWSHVEYPDREENMAQNFCTILHVWLRLFQRFTLWFVYVDIKKQRRPVLVCVLRSKL